MPFSISFFLSLSFSISVFFLVIYLPFFLSLPFLSIFLSSSGSVFSYLFPVAFFLPSFLPAFNSNFNRYITTAHSPSCICVWPWPPITYTRYDRKEFMNTTWSSQMLVISVLSLLVITSLTLLIFRNENTWTVLFNPVFRPPLPHPWRQHLNTLKIRPWISTATSQTVLIRTLPAGIHLRGARLNTLTFNSQ